ncbi:MAG: hypothetical protein V7637_6117 [Mycobacteriales bacterium]
MSSAAPLSPHASLPVPDGLVLAPFRALRYADVGGAELARLLSPPYDVIDVDERRALEGADPRNVVRLILPRDENGLPGSGYPLAARRLSEWRAAGVLRPDERPALYVYEMDDAGARTRGLVGAVGLAAPEANIVLPHENTMAGPVADRLALTEATAANLEPIYLVYAGGGAATEVVAAFDGQPPLVETTAADGVRHRLWALTDPGALADVAADLLPRRATIADGHHRYATYLRHQADRHAAGAGPGPWDRGLALLVDATAYGPQVHPIHRVIPGLALADAERSAAAGFAVREIAGGEPDALAALATAGKDSPAFLITDGTRWVLLTDPDPAALAEAVPADRSAAWQRLDVTIAHRLLVDHLWQLRDHEDVVGFRHDIPAALTAARDSGGTALLLNPTPVEAVVDVAAAGDRMPRKSTLFTPKPRTGLLIRAYADEPDRP